MATDNTAAKIRKRDTGEKGNGGEFGTVQRSEAEVQIATDQQVIDALPRSPGFGTPVLDDREAAETQDFGLEGFAADFTTWHEAEAGETAAEVGVYVPDAAITGTEDIDPYSAETSDEDEQRFHRGSVVLDQMLRERYPDADISYDTEEPRLSWQYSCEGLATREAMHERAWNDPTGPVTFANEADPGTFGHENLGRLFRERMADASMVSQPTLYADRNPESSLTPSDDVNDAAAYQEFADGVEVEMPTDANVRVYAARWAEPSHQMRSLAENGYCSTSRAIKELDQVTPVSPHHGSPVERFEAYQLYRWIEASNEELAEEWSQKS
ncbi:MAG: hypothetical protein L0G94_11155 [Brachybacterium sp.]|uniref:hypothetical protein n=1 Tax=Brachybacterium sp. TaxID=1891286 RepID=UPI002649A423|nr:hypothetical protein [Brachybacterium sp.]MDN5687214.1 hypothetical protein [Brachybacterium sp.]